MPKVREIFSPGLLRAAEFNGKPLQVEIEGWGTMISWGEEFYILTLVGQPQPIKLTTLLAIDIAKIAGDDELATWVGLKVELYPEDREIEDRKTGEDKMITMIRAREIPGAVRAAVVPAPVTPRSDMGDEIQF
jgi:hypothetical protein